MFPRFAWILEVTVIRFCDYYNWLSRAPTYNLDGTLFYDFVYMFLLITFKKVCACFLRNQLVFEILNFIV